MDLDAPLRDDERLFAPKPYERPAPLGGHQQAQAFRLPSSTPAQNGEAPRRKPKKTTAKSAEKPARKAAQQTEVKKKTKRKKKNVEQTYTSIDGDGAKVGADARAHNIIDVS